MEKNYQFLNMDINRPIHRKLTAIQYDNKSRYILVSVFSNFIPYDLTYATVKVFGIKKDKTVFFNNAKILDAKNGKFEIDLTEQCLAVDGDVEIQILILGANQERLSSNSFILNVKKTIIEPAKVTSQNEWGALTEGLANLAEYDIYKNNVDRHEEEIKNNSSKISVLSSASINVLDYGAKCDGITDDTEAIQSAVNALEKGYKLVIPSNSVMNGLVSIRDKGNLTIDAPYLKGEGKFHIQSSLSEFVNIPDVCEGECIIQSSGNLNVNANDYIVLKGTVIRSDYTPARYAESTSIFKVLSIEGGKITLDLPISYSLSDASIALVETPFNVNMNLTLEGIAVDLSNCVGGNINIKQSNVNNYESVFGIITCRDLNVNSNIENSRAVLGLTCNDVYYSNLRFVGKNIGKEDVNIGSKSFRANGNVSNVLDIIIDNSYIRCCVIYGSKLLDINIISKNGGYLNRLNNNKLGNRAESVQLSECDNININAKIMNADDQAFELLACKNVRAIVQASTLLNSTEGCIVIKGGCKDITLLNPILNCNNDYAIKIEGTTPAGNSGGVKATSDINIVNPNIISNQAGLYIRDYDAITNTCVKVEGGYIQAKSPIFVNVNCNSNEFNNVKLISTNSHCLTILSNYNKVFGINCVNTDIGTVRAIANRGIENIIHNCISDGGYIYLGGNAVNDFTLENYKNNSCDIFLEVFNNTITSKRGFWEVDWLNEVSTGKVFGNAKIGDILRKSNPLTGSSNIEYWICTQNGKFSSDNFKAILNR